MIALLISFHFQVRILSAADSSSPPSCDLGPRQKAVSPPELRNTNVTEELGREEMDSSKTWNKVMPGSHLSVTTASKQ